MATHPTFPQQVDTKTGSGTTLAGNSIIPVSGDLYIAIVCNTHASVGTPTLTGTNGFSVTWTNIVSKADAGSAQRITAFRGVASSGVAGVLTADFGGVSQTAASIILLHCQTIDKTTNQGVIQSQSSTGTVSSAPTVTMSAYAAIFNLALFISLSSATTSWTNSTAGWIPFDAIQGPGTAGAMFRDHATLDTAPVGTFGTTGTLCSIGIELKVDATLAGVGGLRAVDPMADNFFTCQCGGGIRGVQISGDREFLFGAGGPCGYIVSDPAGLSALTFQNPGIGVGAGTPYGKWLNRSQRDDSVGNPAPSQSQHELGILRGIFVKVDIGARTISLDCKVESDPGSALRPQIIVKASDEVGLVADVIVTAGSGTAWQTLTASFTAGRTGVVEVWRFKRQVGEFRVWWDNIVLT